MKVWNLRAKHVVPSSVGLKLAKQEHTPPLHSALFMQSLLVTHVVLTTETRIINISQQQKLNDYINVFVILIEI